MLLKDTTLKNGKKLVQLLHQTSDANVKILSKRKSDKHRTLIKSIKVKPQTEVPNKLAKCSNSSAVDVSTVAVDNKSLNVDETTQTERTQATNQNSSANLTQGSTQEIDRKQITDQNEPLNQIQTLKEITVRRLPMNVDQKESTQNNETQLVANQPEVNCPLMIVDKPKTSQCDQNHLPHNQLPNEPDGKSMKTPPWIKQNQVVSVTDKLLLNIIPLQNIATSSNQNQIVTNQHILSPFLRIQINQPNGNQFHSTGQNIQPTAVVNQPTFMNFQNLVPANQIINQSGHQVNQSVLMIAPTQNVVFTQPNQNFSQTQNGGQNNSGQNINVAQNQNVNKTQIERTSVLEVNSLKRKRPTSPVLKEPLSRICDRMNKSKDYDPHWFKKMFGSLDKPKEKVKQGNSKVNNIESVVERDVTMPVIQNVTSLAQSYVSSQSFRNIASIPIETIIKQGSFSNTSEESAHKKNLVDVQHVAVHNQNTGEESNVPKTGIQNNEKKKYLLQKRRSKKHNKIISKEKLYSVSEQNLVKPQRSVIQHTSTIVFCQKVESNTNNTVNSLKVKEIRKSTDVIETAQKPPVTNTIPGVHIETQVIKIAQHDTNASDSELPLPSAKSTVTIEAGAANVQPGDYYVQNTRYPEILFNVFKI